MSICTVRNVRVVVRTRDEHCPPHVHAECTDGWDARFKFSYLNNDVDFWDIKPAHGARISASLIQEVGDAIAQHVEQCRTRFWEVLRTTCLVNKSAVVSGKDVSLCDWHHTRKKVAEAAYCPESRTTKITFADRTMHEIVF